MAGKIIKIISRLDFDMYSSNDSRTINKFLKQLAKLNRERKKVWQWSDDQTFFVTIGGKPTVFDPTFIKEHKYNYVVSAEDNSEWSEITQKRIKRFLKEAEDDED